MFNGIVFHRTELREAMRADERLRAGTRVSMPGKTGLLSGWRQSLA
jgi:hypothetical protein